MEPSFPQTAHPFWSTPSYWTLFPIIPSVEIKLPLGVPFSFASSEVIALYDEEDIEKADQELGKYTLSLLRRSTLVRILLYLQQQRPPPRGRPRGDEREASVMEDEAIAYLQRMQ